MSSRAERNCNPGNIRLSSGAPYQGEVRPSGDSAFRQFESMAWGFRAMFVVLRTYRTRHGLNTIRGIINRWAPPVENHTQNYINFVSRHVGIGTDTPLNHTDAEQTNRLVAAMARIECGVWLAQCDLAVDWGVVLCVHGLFFRIFVICLS